MGMRANEVTAGSSPRMRGTPYAFCPPSLGLGIIPAYAGNTIGSRTAPSICRDHPRVCGEHSMALIYHFGILGSSPRMRGTHRPRSHRSRGCGIIPAYAGNTFLLFWISFPIRDHPRVCGEHHGAVEPRNCHPGSSPRMRGTLRVFKNVDPLKGIIPAYAGNTLRD